jgi:hypothetical protein
VEQHDMTPDELRELTTVWFVDDPQDAPEIAVASESGRYGDVFEFFARQGGVIRPGSSFWDPIARRDVALESVANPGADADAGRAGSFVAEFEGLTFDGVRLPSVMVWPDPPDGLRIFWECGPHWERADVVAAFFDLLAEFTRQLGLRLDFDDVSGSEPVGPRFGAVFAQWAWSRFGVGERVGVAGEILDYRERIALPVSDEIVERLVHLGTAAPGVWEFPEETARRERREAELEAAKARLQQHLLQHAATYAGSSRGWDAGAPVLTISFVGDHAEHEAALAGPGVRVLSAEHTLAELRRIAAEITSGEVLADGAEVYDVFVDEGENYVEVIAYGRDEAAVQSALAERYGDAVNLMWEVP